MTTDPTPLQEQIEAALIRATEDGADRTEHYAAAVLPIITAEVQAAKAEALRQAADLFDSSVGVQDLDNTLYFHGTPWLEASVQAAHENSGPLIDWLRARADTIEKEGRP